MGNQPKRISNPPDATSLMMTARSFGKYDLASALADLVDNSLKAKSTAITISCSFNGGKPEVRIRDNGLGMSEGELRVAMRPACTNPSEERSPDDLGRFGWGLKSASFSQCKILTVISRQNGKISGARWNLDDIDGWAMDVFTDQGAQELLGRPFEEESGTELIWTNCDRLSEDFTICNDQFNDLVMEARKKLSLIFHRYIQGEPGLQKVEISINGTPLDAVDPFCSRHDATIPFDEEVIQLPKSNQVRMKAYVLPHFSKLTANEYEKAGGQEGYVKNQGFYVYRQKRLIIHGTWFGLAKHGELSKLVRVQVDIPNTLDDMWKITVDKSDAQLPASLKARMRNLIERFRSSSTRVFRSKGGRIDDATGTQSIWEKHVRNQKISYSVSTKHPLIAAFRKSLSDDQGETFKAILDLMENQMPLDTIYSDVSSKPQDIAQSFLTPDDLLSSFRKTIPLLMAQCTGIDDLIPLLKTSEPYASNWRLVETYLQQENLIEPAA